MEEIKPYHKNLMLQMLQKTLIFVEWFPSPKVTAIKTGFILTKLTTTISQLPVSRTARPETDRQDDNTFLLRLQRITDNVQFINGYRNCLTLDVHVL